MPILRFPTAQHRPVAQPPLYNRKNILYIINSNKTKKPNYIIPDGAPYVNTRINQKIRHPAYIIKIGSSACRNFAGAEPY